MNINKSNISKRILYSNLVVIISFLVLSISIPAATAERSNGGLDIYEDSHIIQIYQVEDPQDVLVVYETIVMNNSADITYSGTLLFEIQSPMYVTVRLNASEQVEASKINDNLYSIQLPENYTIEPGKGLGLTVEYAVLIPPESIKNFNLKKTFKYSSNLVMLVVYPIDGYEAKGIGIELSKATTESFAGAYISPHFTPVTVTPDESYTIVFSELPEQSSSTDSSGSTGNSTTLIVVFLILLLIVAILIINFYFRKGKSRRKGKESKPRRKESKPEGKSSTGQITMTAAVRKKAPGTGKKVRKDTGHREPPAGAVSIEDEREKLIQDKKNVLVVRKKLKNDLKLNKITKEKYGEKDKKYQARLKEINKVILKLDRKHEQGEEYLDKKSVSTLSPGSSVAALEERKKTLLSVLKHLEKDFEEGNITEDLYDELKSDYKQEAVDILKQLDEMKKAN
jgi:hypothetical protein